MNRKQHSDFTHTCHITTMLKYILVETVRQQIFTCDRAMDLQRLYRDNANIDDIRLSDCHIVQS